jgi:hypothetical protein
MRPVDKPGRNAINPRGFRAESLDGAHSHRLRTFRSLGDLELDSLILLKGSKAVLLDLGMVDEHIFCAAAGAIKSKPFSLLNHFTVPYVILSDFSFQRAVI